jgi:hypothetical protein
MTTPALAQTPRSNGPFAGLFGGDITQPRTEALDFRGSVFGAYQHVVVPDSVVGAVDPRYQQSGPFSGATGSLAYERRTERARFGVNGGATLWQYSAISEGMTVGTNGSTNISVNVSPKLLLDARASVSRSPFYGFSPLLFDAGAPVGSSAVPNGGLLTPGAGAASFSEEVFDMNAGTAVTSNFSKRSGISGALEWRQSRFLGLSANDLASWYGRGTFHHRLSRAMSLHAGYGSEQVQYEASASVTNETRLRNETIDIGVDYGDTLTISRRVRVSFGSSTSVIRFQNDTHFRLNGRASITRGLRRTWSASASYVRDSEYAAGFVAPLLTDSANGWFGGLVNPRTRWGVGGAFSRGTVGFDTPDSFFTYTFTTRLERALSRRMGVFAQYGYYKYQVPQNSTQLPLFSMFSRNIVTGGLTFWAPIISDSRVRTPE